MISEILASARAEIAEAAEFYDAADPPLGDEFVAEINDTIQRICERPYAWTALSSRTRRCLTRRYPFAVIYQVRGNTVLVMSVMHTSRSPNSWKRRLRRRDW